MRFQKPEQRSLLTSKSYAILGGLLLLIAAAVVFREQDPVGSEIHPPSQVTESDAIEPQLHSVELGKEKSRDLQDLRSGADDEASPALLALRRLIPLGNYNDIKEFVQEFEEGEFPEVWSLLSGIENDHHESSLKRMASFHGSKVDGAMSVISIIDKDVGPGTRRGSFIEFAFAGAKEEFDDLLALSRTLDGVDKSSSLKGLSEAISLRSSLSEIPFSTIEAMKRDELTAFVNGLSRFPFSQHPFVDDRERLVKINEVLSTVESLQDKGLLSNNDLKPLWVAMAMQNPVEVWPVIQSDPEVFKGDPQFQFRVLSSLFQRDPIKALDLTIQNSALNTEVFARASLAGLELDWSDVDKWANENLPNLDGLAKERVLGIMAIKDSELASYSDARDRVNLIEDSNTKQFFEQHVNSREEESVRRTVAAEPESFMQDVTNGGSKFSETSLSLGAELWASGNRSASIEWYSRNAANLTQRQSDLIRLGFSRALKASGDIEGSIAWADSIVDQEIEEKTKTK